MPPIEIGPLKESDSRRLGKVEAYVSSAIEGIKRVIEKRKMPWGTDELREIMGIKEELEEIKNRLESIRKNWELFEE
jgi:hypothetical protein